MGFLRKLRDARILKHGLLDEEAWFDILHQHPILDRLSDGEKSRLRELCTLFLHEKTIEGVKGFDLDDFKKQVIAAQACSPHTESGLELVLGVEMGARGPEGLHARVRRGR